jgi:hypothetical protein
MPDFQDYGPASLWLHLEAVVLDFLSSTRLEWKYQINLDVPKEKAETIWLADCQRNRPAIDELVRRVIETDSVREEDPELRYFLAVRFAAALEVLRLLKFSSEGQLSTIFLPVHSDPKAALNDLLVTWWWGCGVFLAFESAWEGNMLHGLLDE